MFWTLKMLGIWIVKPWESPGMCVLELTLYFQLHCLFINIWNHHPSVIVLAMSLTAVNRFKSPLIVLVPVAKPFLLMQLDLHRCLPGRGHSHWWLSCHALGIFHLLVQGLCNRSPFIFFVAFRMKRLGPACCTKGCLQHFSILILINCLKAWQCVFVFSRW